MGKVFITFKPEIATINHRNKLTSNFRHSKKFLLLIKYIVFYIQDRYTSIIQ